RGPRATRPGRAAHLRNYKDVIPPRLWRTLWITFCGEWRTGLSGTPVPVVHQLCTLSRDALVPQEPVLLTAGAGSARARSTAQCSAPPATAASASVRSATS